MLSKYIHPGSKIEIHTISRARRNEQPDDISVYISEVHSLVSADRLEITMPVEKTKLKLLTINKEYDFYFYTTGGMYQSYGRVMERYKDGHVYVLLVELTSNLRKYQRRAYYRYNCAMELNIRELSSEEGVLLEKNKLDLSASLLPVRRGTIVDISGGGLRFVAEDTYQPDDLVYCNYRLLVNGRDKEYHLTGKVLAMQELDNRPGVYEHRVRYVDINRMEREEIIRYIFEAERKNLKKESGF